MNWRNPTYGPVDLSPEAFFRFAEACFEDLVGLGLAQVEMKEKVVRNGQRPELLVAFFDGTTCLYRCQIDGENLPVGELLEPGVVRAATVDGYAPILPGL